MSTNASGDANKMSRGHLAKFSEVLEFLCRSGVSEMCSSSSLARVICWCLPVLAMLFSPARVSEVAAMIVIVGRCCCEGVVVMMLERECECGC